MREVRILQRPHVLEYYEISVRRAAKNKGFA